MLVLSPRARIPSSEITDERLDLQAAVCGMRMAGVAALSMATGASPVGLPRRPGGGLLRRPQAPPPGRCYNRTRSSPTSRATP